MEKYHDLKHEIKRIWNCRSVQVIPLVIGPYRCTGDKGIWKLAEPLRDALQHGTPTAGLLAWESQDHAKSTGHF